MLQLENYEFIGLFYIKDDPNQFQFSGKIIYTANVGIEILFLCPSFELDEKHFDNIYGTVMSLPKRETKYIRLKNLQYLAPIWHSSYGYSYSCKYEYIIFGNSLDVLDANINKVSFGLSEIDKFFSWSPSDALVSKEIYTEKYNNTTINISWSFSSKLFGKFSSHLYSQFDNKKNKYYVDNAELLDEKFKEFLINNNIDENDFHYEKNKQTPVIHLAFDEYKNNANDVLREMFYIIKLFEVAASYPVIPSFIKLVTDRQYNINETPYYHTIEILYGFKRNKDFLRKDLSFHKAHGELTFNVLTHNNLTLFKNWNEFYSNTGIQEILRFIFIIQYEGYYYPDFVLGEVLSAINYIGEIENDNTKKQGDVNDKTKKQGDVNDNIKYCLEKYGTELTIERIAIAIFGEDAILKIKESGGKISYKDKLINKISENNGLAGRVRDFKAHTNKHKLTDNEIKFKNEAFRRNLISYLLLIVKNFCYQSTGIDKLLIEKIMNAKIEFIK